MPISIGIRTEENIVRETSGMVTAIITVIGTVTMMDAETVIVMTGDTKE